MAHIYRNSINIDSAFIEEKSGILNALTYASAQYLYKVIEHYGKDKIKQFPRDKSRYLKRTIIHKNAHLDEYFAELIFRAILPPHLKDIEVFEHVLMSQEDDSFAKISWPYGAVFGIHANEIGGAQALAIYDEHNVDGTRIKPSCSQLVADEYLGDNIPKSIQTVLTEVNYSDSHSGAHQYNIKNIFSSMHDIFFVIGKNEINNEYVTKYLTENWKRAIVSACMASVIYTYENNLVPDILNDNIKEQIERATKNSLDYFLQKTNLSTYSPVIFDKVKRKFLHHFRVWDSNARSSEKNSAKWHSTLDGAIWRDENTGNEICKQILVLQHICYALSKCWGTNIANFIMMHIWQIQFQNQISFLEIRDEVLNASEVLGKSKTQFGSIEKIILNDLKFKPEQKGKDKRKRDINYNNPLWVYDAVVTSPKYPNVATVLKSIINSDYESKGNNGFGLIILHDKIINSKIINNGQTIPSEIWQQVSNKIMEKEGECWFQLKNAEGGYADFIINRNKAHQEQLPSSSIDLKFIIDSLRRIT